MQNIKKYTIKSPPPFSISAHTHTPWLLFVLIPIDLIRHHHHPEQKYCSHNFKRKRSLPRLADTVRLQPGQCSFALTRAGADQVAVAADTLLRTVEQNRRLDQTGEPQHEQDEGAQHHDPRQEQALRNQDDHGEEEDEGKGRDGNLVGEYPIRN